MNKYSVSNLSQDRELRDDELDAATGGLVVISIIQPLIGLLLPTVNSARSPDNPPKTPYVPANRADHDTNKAIIGNIR
jgi:hypothetical protein